MTRWLHWDLTKSDKPSTLIPGLATGWTVDATDKTKWTFKLREGVTFPRWQPADRRSNHLEFRQAAEAGCAAVRPAPGLAGALAHSGGEILSCCRRADARDHHWRAGCDAALSARLDRDLVAGQLGEARPQLAGGGEVALRNRPLELTGFTPRERAELVPNKAYWDKARIPKLDKMVLIPMPDSNARTAALRSGQVDWIEAPAPDAVPALKGAGMQIVTNVYPHNWTWHLSSHEGSPWTMCACARPPISRSIARA